VKNIFCYANKFKKSSLFICLISKIKMFLFLTVWFNICVHPIYVSVTNMDIDAQKGNILMSITIFTEDLETILHNKYNIDGWIGTAGEHRDCRRILGEYVNERFSVAVNNGGKIIFTTDSTTIVEDAMWFYMKGSAKQPIKNIEIYNKLLTDFFSKQTNLVIVNTGNKETGHKLDRKTYKVELSL